MANTNIKVTKKERYEQCIAALAKADIDADLRNDLIDFAKHEIELLESKAAKAKETAAKNKAAIDETAEGIKGALTNELQTINEIVAKINDPDVTVGKAQYRLRMLVENGDAEKEEVTIPATSAGAKARKLMAYRLIAKAD